MYESLPAYCKVSRIPCRTTSRNCLGKLWYMTNIPVLERLRNVVKTTGCRCFTADVMQISFQYVFQLDNHVYCVLNDSTLDFYLVLSKPFLNSEMVLVVIVHLLYDIIHKVNYLIGQNRQIQDNSDCQ